jgi:hypothetical protein
MAGPVCVASLLWLGPGLSGNLTWYFSHSGLGPIGEGVTHWFNLLTSTFKNESDLGKMENIQDSSCVSVADTVSTLGKSHSSLYRVPELPLPWLPKILQRPLLCRIHRLLTVHTMSVHYEGQQETHSLLLGRVPNPRELASLLGVLGQWWSLPKAQSSCFELGPFRGWGSGLRRWGEHWGWNHWGTCTEHHVSTGARQASWDGWDQLHAFEPAHQNASVLDSVMVPNNVHILIPRACEHVTLPGKRNFAGVNKWRKSTPETTLDCPGIKETGRRESKRRRYDEGNRGWTGAKECGLLLKAKK